MLDKTYRLVHVFDGPRLPARSPVWTVFWTSSNPIFAALDIGALKIVRDITRVKERSQLANRSTTNYNKARGTKNSRTSVLPGLISYLYPACQPLRDGIKFCCLSVWIMQAGSSSRQTCTVVYLDSWMTILPTGSASENTQTFQFRGGCRKY